MQIMDLFVDSFFMAKSLETHCYRFQPYFIYHYGEIQRGKRPLVQLIE